MTRAHVRLLGPCFKTGRTGGRLSHREGVQWSQSDPRDQRRWEQVASDRPQRHQPTLAVRSQTAEHPTEDATTDHPIGWAGHLDRSPGPLPNRSEHDGGALSAYRRQVHQPSLPSLQPTVLLDQPATDGQQTTG